MSGEVFSEHETHLPDSRARQQEERQRQCLDQRQKGQTHPAVFTQSRHILSQNGTQQPHGDDTSLASEQRERIHQGEEYGIRMSRRLPCLEFTVWEWSDSEITDWGILRFNGLVFLVIWDRTDDLQKWRHASDFWPTVYSVTLGYTNRNYHVKLSLLGSRGLEVREPALWPKGCQFDSLNWQ